MLIELTDSLIGFLPQESDSIKRSIQNILCGFYEGNNYVIASPAFCSFFQHILLDTISQATLHYLDVNGAFSPSVKYKIRVVLKDPDPTQGEVDYLFFAKTLSVQAPFFLCESLNDIAFYKKLMRYYYPSAIISSFDISGGGESTGDMFLRIQRLKCICLTIVDSDKKYANCVLGNTALKCRRKYKSNNPNIKLFILNCHEAENLIPFDFLVRRASVSGRKFVKRIRAARIESEMRYYDYKLGIHKADVENTIDYYTYFKSIYSSLYNNDVESYYTSKSSEDELLPGIGKNCLSSFLDNPPAYLGTDYLDSERKEIAELVYSFLCGRGNDPLY